ncbi:MAG: hypothetical protein ACPGGK_10470, partial [Pikeienuella sp.]
MIYPIYALWCHPRSSSTAFERVMRERGDLDCLHEPFLYHYYVHKAVRHLPHFERKPGHPTSYEEVKEHLLERATHGPVFFKDMAYYMAEELLEDPAFAKRITHSFLVRDPAESILSYAKLDPEVTDEEIGIVAQWRLYSGLTELKIPSTIIQSAKFRQHPTEMMQAYWQAVGLDIKHDAFEWDKTVPDGWDSVAGWHGEVLSSGGIRPPESGRDYL